MLFLLTFMLPSFGIFGGTERFTGYASDRSSGGTGLEVITDCALRREPCYALKVFAWLRVRVLQLWWNCSYDLLNYCRVLLAVLFMRFCKC